MQPTRVQQQRHAVDLLLSACVCMWWQSTVRVRPCGVVEVAGEHTCDGRVSACTAGQRRLRQRWCCWWWQTFAVIKVLLLLLRTDWWHKRLRTVFRAAGICFIIVILTLCVCAWLHWVRAQLAECGYNDA